MPDAVPAIMEPLSRAVERRGVFAAAEAIELAKRLADKIIQQHASGKLHLYISAETVLLDRDSGTVELATAPECYRSFGNRDADHEFCPPELQQSISVRIATDIPSAEQSLRAAGLASVDSRRIDFYQLTTLLCRLLTGSDVASFLSSPRVVAKVVPEIREFLERALGHDVQRAYRSSAEYVRALAAIETTQCQHTTAVPVDPASSADTAPSQAGQFADTEQPDSPHAQEDDLPLPFTADTPTGMMFQQVYETAPALHSLDSSIPQPISQIIATLLSKSPEAPYQNAESLLADLDAVRQGKTSPIASVALTSAADRSATAPTHASESVAEPQSRIDGGRRQRPSDWRRRIHSVRWFNVAIAATLLVVGGVAAARLLESVFHESQLGSLLPDMAEPVVAEVVEHLNSGTPFDELFFNQRNVFAQPLVGCDRNVLDLAVGPAGKVIAAATGGKQVFVWDAETGQRLPGPAGKLRDVNQIALSSDDSLLATGEESSVDDATIKLWNSRTGELVWQIPGEGKFIADLEFQPGGSLIAASFFTSTKKSPIIWDHSTRSIYWVLPISELDSIDFTFSADGSLLAFLNSKRELVVANIRDRVIQTWPVLIQGQMTFMGDTTRVAVADNAGTLSVVEATTGKLVAKFESLPKESRALTSSRDGRWLATANARWITVIDAISGAPRAVLPGHQTTKVAFSPGGDWLTTAGGAPFVARWPTTFAMIQANAPRKTAVVGAMLAVASEKPLSLVKTDRGVCVWNYAKQLPLIRLKTPSVRDVSRTSAAFSRDARRVAIFDSGGELSIADVLTGEQALRLRIPASASPSRALVEFSDDGKMVWLAAHTGVWRIDEAQASPELWIEWPGGTEVKSLSPGARFAVTIDQQSKLQIWDLAQRQPMISEAVSSNIKNFAFTKDAAWLMAADERGTFYRWSLRDYERTERFELEQVNFIGIVGIAFPQDERRLVVLTNRPGVTVIDVDRREAIAMYRPADGNAEQTRRDSLRLWTTPDWRYAITNSADSDRVLFWDLWIQHQL